MAPQGEDLVRDRRAQRDPRLRPRPAGIADSVAVSSASNMVD